MPSPEAPSSDPVPHDFIDAEISVAGLKTPADEQALNSALSELDGIQTLNISGGKIAVEYDPLRITKAQLSEVIGRAGFRVAEVESGPASSIADALHKEEP
jgi:copper chaperone CopZ